MVVATDQEEDLLIAELLATETYRLGLQAASEGPQPGSTYYTRKRLAQAVEAAKDKCQWLREEIRKLHEIDMRAGSYR